MLTHGGCRQCFFTPSNYEINGVKIKGKIPTIRKIVHLYPGWLDQFNS